jgi:diguanylate cyclase (GGDEF)-like protein/PAS domain S-box-containing protein
VLITDCDGKIEYANAAFERVSGYTRDEVAGQTPRILSSDTIPDDTYEDIWQSLRAGTSRRSTFTNHTKAGQTYDEDTSISIIRDADGKISKFVWIGMPSARKTTIELFKRLVDSSPSGVVVFRRGKTFFVNEQFRRICGYGDPEIMEMDPLDLVCAEDREVVRQNRAEAASHPYEYRLVGKSGAVKWVLESVAVVDFLNLGSKKSIYTAATIIDISRRKATEEDLQYALTLYAATVESTTDGILVVDMNRMVRQLNHRFREMWGLSDTKAYVGEPGSELLVEMLAQTSDPEAFSALGRRVFYTGEDANTTVELLDGRVFEVRTKSQVIDGAIAGQVWNFRDVTERERLESTLLDQANLDGLTGVPSRRYFQEEVNSAISRGEYGAVLFMDVDDFKAINDSLGHSAGDELLRSLARCLSDGLRQNDLLARLGGDEFAILLRGADHAQAKAVAQRLLASVREMKSVSSDQPFSSTISIGGALFPSHGSSVDELLGHADMAMYWVKKEGRNGLHFYRAGHGSKTSSMSRVIWKQKIINALENESFVLHAQPIYELSTGRLGCYELLIRMKEPNGRLVTPSRFLPAAEQSGLIHQIDAWVVQQSLTIAKQLSTAPRTAKIAFNLSAMAVGNPGLMDLIKREISRLNLDPGCVSIELTETALISDLPKARAFFKSLKDLGFLLALDDFGAGFSSLSRLREVPADYLKIHGDFVENITRNQEDRHFVRAISDLATGLGIGAVAQSVQNAETVQILIDLGVLNGQGSYLGAPLPITRILEDHLAVIAA